MRGKGASFSSKKYKRTSNSFFAYLKTFYQEYRSCRIRRCRLFSLNASRKHSDMRQSLLWPSQAKLIVSVPNTQSIL